MNRYPDRLKSAGVLILMLFITGCAALFHWDIHAPGLLSQSYYAQVRPEPSRVGLYITDGVLEYESTNKGGRFADPQTYHIGEAMAPMLVEAFQGAFDEFILIETEPTPAVMKQYGIPYLVLLDIEDFHNQVRLKGQGVALDTHVYILDQDMYLLAEFKAVGTSDARKVFAKKGGPEVNLNAAIESNLIATVQFVQDYVRSLSHEN